MSRHAHLHGKRGMNGQEFHEWSVANVKHQKEAAAQKDSGDEGVATVVSVVYVTMSASFTGATAGYHTVGATETSSEVAVETTTSKAPAKVSSAAATTQSSQAAAKVTSSSQQPTTSIASSSVSHTGPDSSQSVSSQHTTLATISTSASANTVLAGTPIQQTRAADATASPTSTAAASTGMSGGAKAGVAFGVILGLALIAGIALFAIRKKRQQDQEGHEKLADEKSAAPFGTSATGGLTSSASAPRLSLRPVTQFMGIGDGRGVTEMTSATGGLSSFMSPAQPKRNSAWGNRPSTSRSNDSLNPFNDAESIDAEKAAEMNAMNAPIPVTAPATNPFSDNSSDARPVSPEDMRAGPRSTPNSPPKTEFGTAAAVAMPKNQTSPKGPNNVHRVQLDFKPSMDDELDLHVGQVVRVLHEYDDGWVLCMRMDRSKQGVAPRQCLSKNPIKPRAPGPAPIRPSSPAMNNGPQAGRPGPPPGMRNNQMYPAPLSPGFGPPRSQSPGLQQGRGRSQSSASQGQRPIATGPSSPQNHRRSASMGQMMANNSPPRGVPSRKPVPGQAM